MHALVIASPIWRGNPVRHVMRDAGTMRKAPMVPLDCRVTALLAMTGRGEKS